MSDHNADGRSTSKPGGSRTIAATCSSGRGDAAAATSHGGQLSHFVDDSCLKNVALEDDVGSAAEEEETKALRADSLATVDTAQEEERERKVIVVCDGSYLFTVLGALRVALLVSRGGISNLGDSVFQRFQRQRRAVGFFYSYFFRTLRVS